MASVQITLVVDSLGVILSAIAIVCMATIKELNSIFSGTLLSHSVANLLGGFFFLWTTISEIYHLKFEQINPPPVVSMTVSVMLSMAHLMCLVLAEYIQISGRFRYVTKSFRPVIVIIWFLTMCMCSVLFFLDAKITEVFSFTFIIITWLGFIVFYTSVMKYYRNHRLRIVQYSINNIKDPILAKEIYFPRVVLAVYFACTLPWAFKEAHYVNNDLSVRDSMSYYLIMVYSLNFHVVSLTCIYLRCRNYEKNSTYTRHYSSRRQIPLEDIKNNNDIGHVNLSYTTDVNKFEESV